MRKIFFTRGGRLNDAACKLVADFIFHGGGVVYFLDGETDAANLAAIEKAMAAPLPLKLGTRAWPRTPAPKAQQIIRGDFNIALPSALSRRQPAESRPARILRYLRRRATGAGKILLTYADDTPAMASLNHGLGTMLFLMNFSVSEFSSNLARQRIFPAWMQEIVKNLTSDEPLAASSLVGEPVADEVWKSELLQAPLLRPGGEPVETKLEAMGERVALSFIPEELGFYSMRSNHLLHAYGVNASPDESDLRAIDRNQLPDQIAEKGGHGYFVEGRQDFEEAVSGRPVFHWFIIAALVLLLIEQAFQLLMRRAAPDFATGVAPAAKE